MNETLEEYVIRIANTADSDYKELGTTLESCLTLVNRCQEVRDTIKFDELKLLFYIRNGRRGDFYKFYIAAKTNYEANKLFSDLTPKVNN